MRDTPEQQIAALLRLLRPAPAAWVEAACEIPRLGRELARPPANDSSVSEAARTRPAPPPRPPRPPP
jgi:hypothetical protein